MKVVQDPNNLRTFLKWNNKSISRCTNAELVECVIFLTRQLALYKDQEMKREKQKQSRWDYKVKAIYNRLLEAIKVRRDKNNLQEQGVGAIDFSSDGGVEESFLPYPVGRDTEHPVL